MCTLMWLCVVVLVDVAFVVVVDVDVFVVRVVGCVVVAFVCGVWLFGVIVASVDVVGVGSVDVVVAFVVVVADGVVHLVVVDVAAVVFDGTVVVEAAVSNGVCVDVVAYLVFVVVVSLHYRWRLSW